MTEQEQTPTDEIVELAKFIIGSMLPEDAQVEITGKERRGEVVVNINAEPRYRGAVIGKNGVVVRSLRQVLSVGRFGDSITKINVDIVDE